MSHATCVLNIIGNITQSKNPYKFFISLNFYPAKLAKTSGVRKLIFRVINLKPTTQKHHARS